jgi:hypothetical protein
MKSLALLHLFLTVTNSNRDDATNDALKFLEMDVNAICVRYGVSCRMSEDRADMEERKKVLWSVQASLYT